MFTNDEAVCLSFVNVCILQGMGVRELTVVFLKGLEGLGILI